MRECVLFDFDGTIMDTEPAILESFRHVFRKYRTEEEFTPQLQVYVLGPALDGMLKDFFPEIPVEESLKEYRGYQLEHLDTLAVPIAHAMEVLRKLHEKYALGVVSTRYRLSLDQLLERSGMDRYMDVVLGQNDVKQGKPDPEGILKAMEKLNCDRCIYVGDSAGDMKAAHNAGVVSVAYCSNDNKEEALRNTDPKYFTRDLRDLLRITEREFEQKGA